MLSVSGLHLAAVAALLFVLVRAAAARVPRLPLYVDPRAVAAAVALPSIAFFALLTGEAVATLRSALMLSLAMAALPGGPARRRAGPTIAAAALVLLGGAPAAARCDVSLQLSLASVAGIALCARGIGPAPDGGGGRLGRRALRLAVAVRRPRRSPATAATAPLVAHHFGEVAPLAPLGNLALVPLVELGVVPVGLARRDRRRALAAARAPCRSRRPGWRRARRWRSRRGFRGHAPLLAVPHAERARDGGADARPGAWR